MNKKAFTLVELLGVIVIISVLSAIAITAVTNVIKRGKETVYNTQISQILESAYNYTLINNQFLPNSSETKYLMLGELKVLGLAETTIINANTGKEFPDNLVISIKSVNANYPYDKEVSSLKGNYLYTIEFDKLDIEENKPSITLEGNNIVQNTDGNYILVLNLNDSVNINVVESNVKSYIKFDNKVVDTIDTSKIGIYKVYYFAISNGYSNQSILNIIIGDTEPPELSLENPITINTDINSYNLLSGVNCTDNSGFCDIVAGTPTQINSKKYEVSYIATDPSGNTDTARRIINIAD